MTDEAHTDDLAQQIEELRQEIAELRSALATEVRTKRLVVECADEERIVLEVDGAEDAAELRLVTPPRGNGPYVAHVRLFAGGNVDGEPGAGLVMEVEERHYASLQSIDDDAFDLDIQEP